MLGALASITALYTLAGGSSNEGSDLFKVNRVGGMVWVGRPLLLARSITALCILSTATLQLQKVGKATLLAPSRDDVSYGVVVVMQILGTGEVGWLVYIFDDICMSFTREQSAAYATKTALLAWFIVATLSLIHPVSHRTTIQRFGVVIIGSFNRFFLLAGIALGGSTLMYTTERLRWPRVPLNGRDSHLLPCSAKYLFARKGWVHDRIYCIDFASAALTGLLACRYKDVLYVFDIKTWRTLVLTRDEIQEATVFNPASQRRLARALPLITQGTVGVASTPFRNDVYRLPPLVSLSFSYWAICLVRVANGLESGKMVRFGCQYTVEFPTGRLQAVEAMATDGVAQCLFRFVHMGEWNSKRAALFYV